MGNGFFRNNRATNTGISCLNTVRLMMTQRVLANVQWPHMQGNIFPLCRDRKYGEC